MTNDYNLNRIAHVEGVAVLNVNELANAVKPVVLPGEELHVAVIREGKEFHQGIGYLEDGTMIVVEHGRRLIGEETDVDRHERAADRRRPDDLCAAETRGRRVVKWAAVIVAAGRGTRFGRPKQFLELAGLPMVGWSIRRFAEMPEIAELVVATEPESLEPMRALFARLAPDADGARRRAAARRDRRASTKG